MPVIAAASPISAAAVAVARARPSRHAVRWLIAVAVASATARVSRIPACAFTAAVAAATRPAPGHAVFGVTVTASPAAVEPIWLVRVFAGAVALAAIADTATRVITIAVPGAVTEQASAGPLPGVRHSLQPTAVGLAVQAQDARRRQLHGGACPPRVGSWSTSRSRSAVFSSAGAIRVLACAANAALASAL